MNREKGLAKKKLPEKQFIWIIVPLIIVCLLVVGLGGLKKLQLLVAPNQSSYPIVADTQNIDLKLDEVTEIEIRSDCWSGWISTPIVPFRINFRVQAPGDLEYYFWTGEKISVKDNEKKWLGEIPHNNFRLRGKNGRVKIKVEKA